jgi:glycine hydroxymethyltransferase
MRMPARIAKDHEEWRGKCLNLIPSENVMSPAARSLLASDLGHRYSLPGITEMDGRRVENAYRGTRYLDEVEALAASKAREVFDCRYACVRPISGHVAVMVALAAVCRRGDRILSVDFAHGGYPGYAEEEMGGLLGLRTGVLPYDEDRCDIDYAASVEVIGKEKPRAVIVGASKLLFPPEIGRLKDACPEGTHLLYDASHVLGLIAGGQFGDPFAEGADMVFGSTHKTLFGPQGGIVLADGDDLAAKVEDCLHWKTLDNAHWNRISCLAHALLEMKEFAGPYARQVISNAKRLARELDRRGLPVQCRSRGFTKSHQVGLKSDEVISALGLGTFEELSVRLEEADIIVDCVGRMGTQEVTRLGMKEPQMDKIADLVCRVMIDKDQPSVVREEVHRFRSEYTEPQFSLP